MPRLKDNSITVISIVIFLIVLGWTIERISNDIEIKNYKLIKRFDNSENDNYLK